MSKRYLLVKVASERPLSRDEFGSAVIESVRRNFGEMGVARIDPRIVRYDTDQSKAIVSCRTGGAVELQAAIGLISKATETPCVPLVLRVSGTIKALGGRKRR